MLGVTNLNIVLVLPKKFLYACIISHQIFVPENTQTYDDLFYFLFM